MKSFRQKELVDILQKDKIINTKEMAKRFDVSIETLRRDLDQLEKQGIINKTYGGAELKLRTNIMPSPLQDRRAAFHSAKAQIAAAASAYIPDGCTIALDAGSTVYELCPYLNEKSGLTIVCGDIHAAAKLLENRRNKIYMMGGFLTPDGTSNGTFAKEFFNSIAGIDIFLCSTDGAGLDEGLSCDEAGINDLKKRYLRTAGQKIGLIDHSKFMRRGFYKTCDFSDLDLLITDQESSEDVLDRIRRTGIRVEVAPVNYQKPKNG